MHGMKTMLYNIQCFDIFKHGETTYGETCVLSYLKQGHVLSIIILFSVIV